MKNLAFLLLLLLIGGISNAQNYDDVLLVFNNKQTTGSTYRLKDIIETDTLKTSNDDLTIISFWCSSTCQIDWEVKHKSNRLSSIAKHYIKNCAKRPRSRVYFYKIKVKNKQGKIFSLDERIIMIY